MVARAPRARDDEEDQHVILSVLEKNKYVEKRRSKVFPKLDVAWLHGSSRSSRRAAPSARADVLREKRR